MGDIDKIVSYIKANTVLTLCTARAGEPWAANAYYAFDATAMTLYVLTRLETRHGADMLENNRIAGTIASQQRNPARIRGLQWTATAGMLAGAAEQAGRAVYDRRFPFARLQQAPLWALRLETLKLTDNTLGFGSKLRWTRPD